MKIEELATTEEKLGEVLIKMKEMESDLSSKNDLLISQVCFKFFIHYNSTNILCWN